MPNRFEKVDEPPSDALTLTFEQRADGQWAKIHCPPSAIQNRLPKGFNTGDMAPFDALTTAVKFANDFKAPIVVIDPDNVWKKEWGELYRWEDEPEAQGDAGGPAA